MASVWEPLRYAVDNNLIINEPDANFAFVQDILVSSKVISTLDRAGNPSDLALAGSSNVNVLAANDVSLYATSNVRFFASNDEVLNVGLSNDGSTALLTTGASRVLHIRPTDSLSSTWLGNLRTYDTSAIPASRFQELDTVNNLGVRVLKNLTANEPVTMNSTLHVASRVTMGEHLKVDGDIVAMGNIFTPHIKVWRDNDATSERVGFGLHVNASNMLEMYKYVQDASGSNAIKRVAVFGHSTFDSSATPDFTDSNWTVMSGMLSDSNVAIAPGNGGGLFFINSNYDIYTTARLGVGTSNPSVPLEVAGTVQCTTLDADNVYSRGGVQASSDARLKADISPLSTQDCLSQVLALKPCTFKWISNSNSAIGLVAQEVAEFIPQAVAVHADSFTGLSDMHFLDQQALLATLIGAVQALAERTSA
jgi:hypothetical protein